MSTGAAFQAREAAERHGQGRLEQALTRAFWQAMHGQPMPVMAALEAAARTVGALYRQAAAAHGPAPTGSHPRCGCGWHPDPDADLVVLEAMLAAAALQPPVEDLAGMAVAGRA